MSYKQGALLPAYMHLVNSSVIITVAIITTTTTTAPATSIAQLPLRLIDRMVLL